MNKVTNALTAIVALLVFSIGAGAFVLSYDALLATGQAHGSFAPGKAWIFPLLIDAPLVVFTLALLVFQIMRQGIKLWAGLVILYTLATIGFNLSHAQPTPLGWLVAVVAPMGLLLTTEAMRHLSKVIIDRQALLSTLAELITQVDTRRADLDRLNGQIERAAAHLESIKVETKREMSANIQELNAARQAKIEERRDKVLELLSNGHEAGDIAAALGVTVKTIKRDITALNGKAVEVRGTL